MNHHYQTNTITTEFLYNYCYFPLLIGPKDPKEVVCVLVLVEVVRAKYHLGTICGLGGLGPK